MLAICYGFFLTLAAYLLAKPVNKKLPQIPVIVIGMFFVIVLLYLFGIPYENYMAQVNPLFNDLLGYVTVALAIPLAAMRYDDLPLKAVAGILVFASISAVALPMGLAYLLHLSDPTIIAFATRAVTTPIAINIATLLHSPVCMSRCSVSCCDGCWNNCAAIPGASGLSTSSSFASCSCRITVVVASRGHGGGGQPGGDASGFNGAFVDAGSTDLYRLSVSVPLDAGKMLLLVQDVALSAGASRTAPWRVLRTQGQITPAAG